MDRARNLIEALLQDARYALRSLRKSPGFAAVVIVTLALGIGGNTAVFSVVDAVLLRPLPYEEPERVVDAGYVLPGEYLVLRDGVAPLAELALYRSIGFNLSDDAGAERLHGAHVSANLFSVLRATPSLGRGFLPGDDEPGGDVVVVIAHALWRQRFGGDPSLVGREITVDGERRTVVGVMPPGFHFPATDTRLWVPFTIDASDPVALWGGGGGQAVARLAPGVTPARAQAAVRALAPELRQANTLWDPAPEWGADRQVTPLRETVVGEVRTRLWVLLGAVGFVLLIACVNVANLLLARATSRQREVAVRSALGAARGRLVRQHLTEGAVLGVFGGFLGLVLAWWAVQALVGGLPADTPRVEEIALDGRVLGFTMAVSVLASLLFGAVPALRSTRPDVRSALKVGGDGSRTTPHRLAGALVVAECAVAVVLVIGAGLLVRSFAQLMRVDPGFRTESLVTARITLPEGREDDAELRAFYDEVLVRVEALPGVRAAEAVSVLPLKDPFSGFAFEVEGDPYVPGTAAPITADRRITPGYARTMGIPLLEGRALTEADREGAPKVALINRTMAREFWPGEDPVGKRFKEVWLDEWTTVVGVLGDVRSYGLAREVEAEVFRPFAQLPARDMSVVVRTSSDPNALAASLRATVASVDAEVPVSEIRTLEQVLSTSMAGSRFTMSLVAGFAVLALVLAAVGIYGVISCTVGRRRREIGLRVALGARRSHVLRDVLRQALSLAGLGAAMGVVGGLGAARLLESLLYGVNATDTVTFVVVPLVLLGVALLASYLPARRATRVDPLVALRSE